MEERLLYAWGGIEGYTLRGGKVSRPACRKPEIFSAFLNQPDEKSTEIDLEICIREVGQLLSGYTIAKYGAVLWLQPGSQQMHVWTDNYHPRSLGSDETGSRVIYRTSNKETLLIEDFLGGAAGPLSYVLSVICGVPEHLRL